MSWGRALLVAGVLAALALGAAPAASQAAPILTVVGNTSGSALMQTGQLNRDSVPSDCDGTLKFSPSLQDTGSTFRYRNHTFRNFMNEPACFEVDISTACTLFSVGYIGTFNPANPLENYAADMGSTAGTGGYSFVVPAGSFFGAVIHEVSACAGNYTVTFASDGPWTQTAPAIAGTPAIGASLIGTNSTWTAAATVTRRWRRCNLAGAGCTDIPGATGASYTVTAADLGRTLRFRNTATDPDATRTADSQLVEPFLPFAVRMGQSLGAGDRTQSGLFARGGPETRCGVPTPPPGISHAGLELPLRGLSRPEPAERAGLPKRAHDAVVHGRRDPVDLQPGVRARLGTRRELRGPLKQAVQLAGGRVGASAAGGVARGRREHRDGGADLRELRPHARCRRSVRDRPPGAERPGRRGRDARCDQRHLVGRAGARQVVAPL